MALRYPKDIEKYTNSNIGSLYKSLVRKLGPYKRG